MSIQKEVLASAVKSNLLIDISQTLCKEWRDVGRLLDLKQKDIDEIECNIGPEGERAYQMLCKWKEKTGSSAKLFHLVAALSKANQNDAIVMVKKLYRCYS